MAKSIPLLTGGESKRTKHLDCEDASKPTRHLASENESKQNEHLASLENV